MADEEEVELTEEQLAEIALQKELAERMPNLANVADFDTLVSGDEENLVMVAALSKQCPYSNALQRPLSDLAIPRGATKHARFYRLDVSASPEIAQKLGIFQTPTTAWFLKGEERARHIGDGFEKISGIFRNELIKRNEEMREYDEAKLARERPPPAEDEEAEEGEENEEDADE